MADSNYYRLIVRFTNGETEKFILRESIDTREISEKARFMVVRARQANSDESTQLFLASLKDISYIKVQTIETKDLRHRVAGIAGTFDDTSGPEALATVEFL